jgi:hypothetical protein
MDPQSWPFDPVLAAAMVLRAVDDIDESTEEERDTLLCDLLCAAWGSVWAQNQ